MGPKSFWSDSRAALTGMFAGMDLWLLGAVILMGAITALNLYGVGGADHALFTRSLTLTALSLAVILLVSRFNYRYLKNWTVPVLVLYIVAGILVASTLWFSEIRNIRAWIVIGGWQFEPSELLKLALIVLLAKYFSQRHMHISQFRHVVASGLYVGAPAAVVLMQPDLGSAAILGCLWLAMLLAAGIRVRHLFLIGVAGMLAAYLAWLWALAPYQRDRISAFIDPYRDPAGYGYHIIQSQAAIGSGGLWGSGLGQGSQATLGFLPEPYNDFAFAAWTEQFGLAGALAVIALMAFIVLRVLAVGRRSSNNFARLFCIGVAAVLWAHAFVSMGVNIGILPITGIPLSFLSYGGSHLLSMSVAVGVVQSISRNG